MRRYYNLHRDRMEVVCIECEMSKRLWKNSIKAWDLDWTSIYAEDKTLYYLYGVEGYPTKIIISPDGIVHQYYNTGGVAADMDGVGLVLGLYSLHDLLFIGQSELAVHLGGHQIGACVGVAHTGAVGQIPHSLGEADVGFGGPFQSS